MKQSEHLEWAYIYIDAYHWRVALCLQHKSLKTNSDLPKEIARQTFFTLNDFSIFIFPQNTSKISSLFKLCLVVFKYELGMVFTCTF